MKDILLDENDKLMFANGDFAVGDSLMQEVSSILRLNQGELKQDPILGPGLIRKINSNAKQDEITDLIKKHLARDGKDWNDLKQLITITTKQH